MTKKPAAPKSVEALKHDEAKRKNIPTAEFQSVLEKEQQDPKKVHYSRAFAHAARQLPNLPPNPHASGPSARPGGDRRGWQCRGPERYGVCIQRSTANGS